jgi:hypothetical protein
MFSNNTISSGGTYVEKRKIMKKGVKITLIVIGVIVGLLVIAAVGYRVMFSQGVATSFEVNNPDLETKVLIATQGSNFKDALVSGIIEELKTKAVYIKVIDVTALSKRKEEEWNAVLVLSTCQSQTLQAETMAYLQQAKELEKHVVLITSGAGDWQPKEAPFDSISSASKMANVAPLVARIIKQLEGILEKTSS